jgi:hypothetical protein
VFRQPTSRVIDLAQRESLVAAPWPHRRGGAMPLADRGKPWRSYTLAPEGMIAWRDNIADDLACFPLAFTNPARLQKMSGR